MYWYTHMRVSSVCMSEHHTIMANAVIDWTYMYLCYIQMEYQCTCIDREL